MSHAFSILKWVGFKCLAFLVYILVSYACYGNWKDNTVVPGDLMKKCRKQFLVLICANRERWELIRPYPIRIYVSWSSSANAPFLLFYIIASILLKMWNRIPCSLSFIAKSLISWTLITCCSSIGFWVFMECGMVNHFKQVEVYFIWLFCTWLMLVAS